MVPGLPSAHIGAPRPERPIGARASPTPPRPRQPHALKIEAQLTTSDPSPSIARRSQKLQRAGFVSVRDVKKTHGPVELALGTRVAPRTPRAPSTPMWAPPPPRVPSFPRFSPAAPPRSQPLEQKPA